MKQKIITLKHVAEAANVSVTAVSLVLNGKICQIPESTKERIWEKARKLHYRPNSIALSLATKKTKTIGIIIPDITNAFFAQSVHYLQSELTRHGYVSLLCDSEERFDKDYQSIELLASRQVDGLILALSAESFLESNQQKIVELLHQISIPHVFFDRCGIPGKTVVSVDNQACGAKVIRYLLRNGHKQIGVISGLLSLSSSRERLMGVREALSEVGLKLDQHQLITTNFSVESGRLAASRFDNKVTAIFAFDDLLAYGVMEALRAKGVRVPEDISLVGFDDLLFSALLGCRLTTISQPIKDMANKCCELLMAMIKTPFIAQSIRLPGELIIRDSVQHI